MAMQFTVKQPEKGCQIIGIKKAPSKDGKRTYTTYYAVHDWSDYELGRSDLLLSGLPVEEYQTTEDFPIHIGDVVEFYFGKAIGDFQPLIAFSMIQQAVDVKASGSGSK